MSRTLLLFRHAKSSWDQPGRADFDRPLNRRGLDAATRMGLELCARAWFPQRAIVSTARRTRQTWELAEACLPTVCETVFDPSIYEAVPDAILAAIRRTPATVASLIVVGHNPGLEDLSGVLAAPSSDASALSALHAGFPTSAIARFETDAPWDELGPRDGRLTDFLTPRSLG
jgi:phosphohistidine phosphatase